MEIRIERKNGTNQTNHFDVESAGPSGLALNCSSYEYGERIAAYMKSNNVGVDTESISILSSERVLHKLLIMPSSDGFYFTDHGDGCIPPAFTFVKREQKLSERYLILVDPERNKNEFYKMQDMGAGEWGATSGRIGEKQSRSRFTRNVVLPKKYKDYMYPIKLYEKLKNGYSDESDCHKATIIRTTKTSTANGMNTDTIKDTTVRNLMNRLIEFAQLAISENYTVTYTDVTPEMIRKAQNALTSLRTVSLSGGPEEFNEHLLSLMRIIPRKIDRRNGVQSAMASSRSDYASIVVRETDLLDVMESQIRIAQVREDSTDLLTKLGLQIRVASEEETRLVKSHLGSSLTPQLKAVYRVINLATEAAFQDYIRKEERSGNAPFQTKLLWHGSRNQNWLSILQNGLVLNPNAIITGKMFGQGIYFAPSSAKSWGYTSGLGARYTEGGSETAIMGLYTTAYGKPYEVYSWAGDWNGYNYTRLKKEHPDCNCVHAKADRGMLRNDEIIFYSENQVTVSFLCEFGQI